MQFTNDLSHINDCNIHKKCNVGLFPFKGTIRSFKRNRSLLTEEHLIALKGRAKSSFNF